MRIDVCSNFDVVLCETVKVAYTHMELWIVTNLKHPKQCDSIPTVIQGKIYS